MSTPRRKKLLENPSPFGILCSIPVRSLTEGLNILLILRPQSSVFGARVTSPEQRVTSIELYPPEAESRIQQPSTNDYSLNLS